jgi:hypothetical protein
MLLITILYLETYVDAAYRNVSFSRRKLLFNLQLKQESLSNLSTTFGTFRFSKKTKLTFNLLNPTDHVTHQQFNIQQLYVLPTLYLCVSYLSENKQRLVPLTA